jgi:hypothetical protein
MGKEQKPVNERLSGIFGRKMEMRKSSDLAAILSATVKQYEAKPAINGFPAYAVVTWGDDTQSCINWQQLVAFNCKQADELMDNALRRMGYDNDKADAEQQKIRQDLMNRIVELRRIAHDVAYRSEQYARFTRAAAGERKGRRNMLTKRFYLTA